MGGSVISMGDRCDSVARRFRLRSGLTQEALAGQAGLSVSTIRRLETGRRRNPQLTSLRRLADALNLASDERDELLASALDTVADPTRTAGISPLPRQLPAAHRGFTGRDRELTAITQAMEAAALVPTVAIATITGSRGTGKTCLAVQWAQHNVDRFPDGQLFIDLHGVAPGVAPMESGLAVGRFLDALGVQPSAIPTDPSARAALYRSLMADLRMLIVLDNASNTEQVAPLLPGGAGCAVIVTSQNRLKQLVAAHGATPVVVETLDDIGARRLLSARLGEPRLATEPDAVADLLMCCAGLPLALAAVAAVAQLHPDIPLAVLASEFRDVPGIGHTATQWTTVG